MNAEQRLWDAYRDDLKKFLMFKGAEADLAQEIVQETLIKAYESRGTLRDVTKLKPWLLSIARNKLTDVFRKANRYDSFDVQLHDSEVNSDFAEVQSEGEPIAACLLALVQQLPEEYRIAVTMADLENQKQKAVAEVIGLSVSGAKSRVQRGRSMLKEKLFACCPLRFNESGRPVACESVGSCSSGISNA
jgi:RNA polymerase sigma-70 factor (ECF subfamily)